MTSRWLAFDTELEEIYHALLDLLDRDRSLDLTKVVVDIYLQVNEKHNCRPCLILRIWMQQEQKPWINGIYSLRD